MALRPIAFSIPSTTELKVTFSSNLSKSLSAKNFEVESLNGAVDSLDVIGISIDDRVATIKTRPQVSSNYYLLKFLDTEEVIFANDRGIRLVDDAVSRELFFVGIDTVNPFRDRMLRLVPSLFDIENTVLKSILSTNASELYSAQKSIGEVLSNNYISEEVTDEVRTRTIGAVDRLANEGAYDIFRVSNKQTGDGPTFGKLNYTGSNPLARVQELPVFPISLQQVEVVNEQISIDTEGNSFDGFLIDVKNKNIIKLLSIKVIKNGEIEDCDGNIGKEYDIEKFKYTLKDNFYDQDFAFEFSSLSDSQILLSEFGNVDRPGILDTIILTYLYKDLGRLILEDEVMVSRVESRVNESVPSNSTKFFLKNAPIVSSNNKIVSSRGVTFKINENSTETPREFRTELIFNLSKLPSLPGEYSINYETGEVFLVGATELGEGTGRNNYVVDYLYRREFFRDIDYSIDDNNLVAMPDRSLGGAEAEITIRYDLVYVNGVDYRVSSHVEVMPELVTNRLNQSFSINTLNAPITNVYRILNQTTGEVYTPLYNSDTEIFFSGRRSPEIKTIDSEENNFQRVTNERINIIGEFIIPAFRTRITSGVSNNSILFEPGIPAELISQNSTDYFIRETNSSNGTVAVDDAQIRFFGDPGTGNLITSVGISPTATPPGVNSKVIIGTRGYIVSLNKTGIVNNNRDSLASLVNTSMIFNDNSIFSVENYFEPININPGLDTTTNGGISVALTADKGSVFDTNLSRLRKVGDYTADYKNGLVYVAVSLEQDLDVGTVSYTHNEHKPRNNNILDVTSVAKKTNAARPIQEASIAYSQLFNDDQVIRVLDLDDGLTIFDNKTKAVNLLTDERELVCEVLEDYTVVVPHEILSINSIFRLGDMTGLDLSSSSEANRQEEYTPSELTKSVRNGGRNIYDASCVQFSKNVIDLKKKVRRRFSNTTGGVLSLSILDDAAATFVRAVRVSTEEELFDDKLNVVKLDGLSIVSSILGSGTAIVEVDTVTALDSVDADGDFLLDVNGDRFEILAVSTITSTITVSSPAINNITADKPALDPAGTTEVVVKAAVLIADGIMTITIPGDTDLVAGELVEITYLTDLIPEIGTSLAIDYRFGFLFFDYTYLADNLAVWYEYGDNSIDWSINDSINEGKQYFVSYRYGASREALRKNFGSITDIPFFQSFPLNIDRELYRSAIKGTLQAFAKGPTIPAYEDLIKSFTAIEPNIDELVFGNWILGRDYLYPGDVNYKGILQFADGRFNDGLKYNDDVVTSIPAISSMSLGEGTLEAWIRPDWAGLANDANITFRIDNIGPEKIILGSNSNPFDSAHDWNLLPATNTVGGTDFTGSGVSIFNFRTDTSKVTEFDQGAFGIYKNIEELSRITDVSFGAELRVSLYGTVLGSLGATVDPSLPDTSGCEEAAPAKVGYEVGTFVISDGYRIAGAALKLEEVAGFDFNIVGDGLTVTADEIPDYDRPHITGSYGGILEDTTGILERFNELLIEVDLGTTFSMASFKSSNNILDDLASAFVIVDSNDAFYEVVAFNDDDDSIPDSITKVFVKRFPINNPALSGMDSSVIDSTLPTGDIQMHVKTIDFYTKSDFGSSTAAFGFEKSHVVDWKEYNKIRIDRRPIENLVDIKINESEFTMFYTDLFFSCNFGIGLDISTDELKGIVVGSLDKTILSNVDLLRGSGTFHNRFDLSDIYIGRDAYNPVRMPFTVNKDDFPLVASGLPFNADLAQGVFVGFDELCISPLSDDLGQWIFRARAARRVAVPVSVSVAGLGDYTLNIDLLPIEHNFSGEIFTNGEFSSVSRATRDELSGGCSPGLTCDFTFRFCGNELLEEFGWVKLDESESELIDVLVGGRETQRGSWRKHGEFVTSSSSGVYRMGPSAHDFTCVEEDNYLGNLVYTETPCLGGNVEYINSLRVAQVDTGMVGSLNGSFSGAISGVLTGVVPIHVNDGEINIKVALALSSVGEPLVIVIDFESGLIIDIISFNWNDLSFHEFKILKNKNIGTVKLFIDDIQFSEFLITEFSLPNIDLDSDFTSPNVSIYVFDATLSDSEIFHSENDPNIIDIDLVFYSSSTFIGDGYLEATDLLINTDHRIEFSLNIDQLDAYIPPPDAYDDGYTDGYADDLFSIDEIFFSSDKLRYIVDTGIGDSDRRFSIFKDGKGFLNFRIFDDSLSKGEEVGLYNLATNIKHFKAGELHHVAASWNLNTLDERDEMRLFIDGLEAPNIFKFGGRVPVRITDKFSDISKETLQNFLIGDIDHCQNYTGGTVVAGSSIFLSASTLFNQSMVGRSIIIESSALAPTLVGKEFIINSVVDSQQVTLARGEDLKTIEFSVSSSDLVFSFAPVAGLSNNILTDLRNSKFVIKRTQADGTTEEYGGILYVINNGVIDVIRGENVEKPQFRANIDTRIIEFVGEDENCNFVASVVPTDLDVHIETFGLNLERTRDVLELSSSSFDSGTGPNSGLSVIKTLNVEPVSLRDVDITRIVLKKTALMITDVTTLTDGRPLATFEITFDEDTRHNSPTSKPGQIFKQNMGRKLSLFFDTDNVDFCEFDGYEDGYQDGSLDGLVNTITIFGETTDGIDEETFFIDKNGLIPGNKFFTDITSISGNLIIVDEDYFELGVISIRESNKITTSDNGGERAEIFDYRSGLFVLTVAGSGGAMPFELHPGYYELDYPAYLKLTLPAVGHDIFIGSDFNEQNQFGGTLDEFRIISEKSSDTRPTEITTGGTRSVTADFNRSIPFCQDNQTLALLHFDNPINEQARRLRNTKFLDRGSNFKFNLSLTQQEKLLEVVNDPANFISRMLNMSFSEDEAVRTFYEVHKANNGPLINKADFYRNVIEFAPSDSSVNSTFGSSAFFSEGTSLLINNRQGQFRKEEGTVELWISPLIDTSVDNVRRYYVDIFSANRVRVKATSPTVVELPSAALEVHEVRLIQNTQEFSQYFSEDEVDQILFDEVSRSEISGRLEGGTGVKKDFSQGHKLSADGTKIFLADPLPGENTDLVITYVPIDSNGDRFSIFKNEYNQMVFAITGNGVDNVVSIDIDWKANTWHRVLCSYRTNSDNNTDTMNIFGDGIQGGIIRYGTGIIYGTGFIYGQFEQAEGQARNQDFSIDLSDDFRLIAIGSDIFGDNVSRSRLDNVRFSRIIRNAIRDTNGNFVDLNYSDNTNTIFPVIEDDATTLLLNFDEDGEKIDKFATIIDPERGIFEFDIEVVDDFDKVINVNDGQIEDLIVDLVNKLKPAHANALVKFTKNKC
jgi:hypothetical protein